MAYLSVPLVWLVCLWRVRRRLDPPTLPGTPLEAVLAVRAADAGLAPLRFLFEPYRPAYYFWEAIELYRRIAFIGVLPLMSAKADRRAAIGALLAVVRLQWGYKGTHVLGHKGVTRPPSGHSSPW